LNPTFKHFPNNSDMDVLLEVKIVGRIRYTVQGWQYVPKGKSDGGEHFSTLYDCKKSLSTEI
jgi:hypothetical protein